MHNYYCKNCNNIIGKWCDNCKYYYGLHYYCNHITSKNINSINFLNCKKCNKFVGILCYNVCENCFGKEEILFGEENLFNWFFKYKKIIPETLNSCKNCNNKYDFRSQPWFFGELTFYK